MFRQVSKLTGFSVLAHWYNVRVGFDVPVDSDAIGLRRSPTFLTLGRCVRT
jgi:hypothetical protein